jgi:hypothetical protein
MGIMGGVTAATNIGAGAASGAVGGSVLGPLGTVAGAILGAGTSILSGILNNYATDKTNKQTLALAAQQRADTLAQNKIENDFKKQQIGLQKQSENFSEKNTTEENKVKAMQNSFQQGQQLYANQINVNKQKAAPFLGGK